MLSCGMVRRFVHLWGKANGYERVTLARLRLYDWLAGPMPETPADCTRAEERDRLHKALPQLDFDYPRHPMR